VKKEIALLIGCFSFIVFVILLNLLLANQFEVAACSCPKMVSHNFVWLFVGLSIIYIGCLLYYLFTSKIEDKNKVIKQNFKILYSILDVQEKELLNKLIENDGNVEQSELSEVYGKIKAHRLIKKLEEKNIVNVIKRGKTNQVELKKELKEELI
jgi:hypothetical protein